MPSSFQWVDFSDHDRRRMSDVISMFQETETLDELGIGVIRDSIADRLFPGTSTLQTRAKYFLLIPWIYQLLARTHPAASASEVSARLRIAEGKLIRALEAGGEKVGVIGIERREKTQRMPSSIFWAGLKTLGIRRFSGSQDQMNRAWRTLNRREDDHEDSQEARDGEAVAGAWDLEMPSAGKDFLKESTFELSTQEAYYLRALLCPEGRKRTLFGHLVESDAELEAAPYFWMLSLGDQLPAHLKSEVAFAQFFSDAVQGAVLIYNLLLAEGKKDQDSADSYREQIDKWTIRIENQRAAYVMLAGEPFWAFASECQSRHSQATQRFVEAWLEIALGEHGNLSDHQPARDLVIHRERTIKGARARIGNPKALDAWNSASNIGQLNYRWHRVYGMVRDIQDGLRAEAEG